ncbi:MAG: glycosyltransferase [Candidatus Omnitrophica bacterium]|nr:glycosyltransferase [Candidatus Omnitrophota bacterium]
MKTITRQDIAAVIVTFYPDDDFEAHVSPVLSQVDKVVVVDNTADPKIEKLLLSLRDKGCQIIRNKANLGVACALNQGICRVAEQGYKWVLTLDQDTHVHEGLIDLYIHALCAELADQKAGVINTLYRDVNTGTIGLSFSGKKIDGWMDVAALITSGSFFSIETYQKVGPLREYFFLDWADHDFCLRARAKGLRNFIYNKPFFDHALGKKTEHKFFFRKLSVPTNNHSPFRCYLISRNLTILLKENFFHEFRWALFLSFYLLTKFLLVVFFEKDKISKLQNLLKGFLDGLFSKSKDTILLKHPKQRS